MSDYRKSLIDSVGGLTEVNTDTFTAPEADLDKFRRLIVSSEQTVIDAAVQIVVALPKMPVKNIELVMSSISFLSKKLWYLRALCIAELMRRREPLAGGRSRRAAPGEGHKEFIKEWAERLGVGTTKLQQDLKIVEVFSTRFMFDESGKINELKDEPIRMPLVFSDEDQKRAEKLYPKYSQTIKFEEDGDYIEAVAFSYADGKPLYAALFTPHPQLSREHYVVMSRMNNPAEARQKEAELIELAERGEPLPTAVALNKQVLKHSAKSEKQGGFFGIRRDMAFMQTHIKFTMTTEDSELFKQVAEFAFDVEDFPLHKSISYLELFGASGDGYKLLMKALQAYLVLLKSKRKKDWTIERTLNPENFTDEISRKKMDAGHAQSKLTNQVRREKKRVADALIELEKTMPGGIDKESDAWKSHEKKLIKLSRLEEAAVSARDAYLSITMKNLNLSSEEQEETKNQSLLKYREVEELTGTKMPDVPPAKTKKPKQLKSKD